MARGASMTKVVLLLTIIPCLLMIAVFFNVAMYAVSAPATVVFDIVIVFAIIYDVRQALRKRSSY